MQEEDIRARARDKVEGKQKIKKMKREVIRTGRDENEKTRGKRAQ